ncbi:MAG: M23 family metallopeptidase, partial [Rudaea sp.]
MKRSRYFTFLTSAILLSALAIEAAGAASSLVTAPQGGVARWSAIAAKECGIYGKHYLAVDAVCYYPIDIQTSVGRHEIALWDQEGKQHLGYVMVTEQHFPEVHMDLPPDLNRYLELSPQDIARATRETAEVAKILPGSGGAPHFSLPLGKPASTLPRSANDFGSTRTFNGKIKSLHSGLDFPVNKGSRVKAVAAGTVVLAADNFFTGNAVFIDHGDGLVSMYFHLQSLGVKTGDTVKRGQTLGRVGGTGRATGPHLHIGLRWLGKRIDPERLFQAPTKLPAVSDTKAEAAQKIRKADQKVPKEGDTPLIDEG